MECKHIISREEIRNLLKNMGFKLKGENNEEV